MRIRIQITSFRIQLPYYFDADPDPTYHSDPAYHFDADPDPAYHSDADPDPTF